MKGVKPVEVESNWPERPRMSGIRAPARAPVGWPPDINPWITASSPGIGAAAGDLAIYRFTGWGGGGAG